MLEKDCPTTGGYELAAVILPSEAGRFSQLRSGSKVRFEEVGEEEASKDFLKFMKLVKKYSSGTQKL